MNKQEEIREWLMLLVLPDKQAIEGEWGSGEDDTAKENSYELVDKIISYLHSQGVVIKVDKELPIVPNYIRLQDDGGWSAFRLSQRHMLCAGYEAVEPLIEVENG